MGTVLPRAEGRGNGGSGDESHGGVTQPRAGAASDKRPSRIPLDRLLLLVVVALSAWVIFFAVVTAWMPYPIEFREGAAPVMTQFLLEGRNPYALDNQPLGTYHYGIVYSAIVLPLAALFGNGLLVHRVVTILFILLCAGLVGWSIFRGNRRLSVAAACGLLVAMALATRGGVGAFPGSLGTFLFLAVLIIPFRRSFDWPGLLWSTLLSLAAFYTKPYFVLALAIVVAYTFLFVSKQRALHHVLISAAAFLLSFIVVRRVFPLYFVYVIFTSYLDAGPSAPHLLTQIIRLNQEFFPTIALGFLILLALWKSRSRITGTSGRLPAAGFRRPAEPLLAERMDYFGLAAAGSVLAFLLILGPHTGQFMTYAYQLVLPPLLIWLGLRLNLQGRMRWAIAPVLVLNLVWFGVVRLNPALLDLQHHRDWARLYRLIDHSQNILNSPVLVGEMIKDGKWPVDSGQSEYYYILTREYAALGTLLGPDYEELHARGREYLDSIMASLRHGEYDLVALPIRYEIGIEEAMGSNYVKIRDLELDMPQTSEYWPVSIWKYCPGQETTFTDRARRACYSPATSDAPAAAIGVGYSEPASPSGHAQ
jgi:hypothetical protein